MCVCVEVCVCVCVEVRVSSVEIDKRLRCCCSTVSFTHFNLTKAPFFSMHDVVSIHAQHEGILSPQRPHPRSRLHVHQLDNHHDVHLRPRHAPRFRAFVFFCVFVFLFVCVCARLCVLLCACVCACVCVRCRS